MSSTNQNNQVKKNDLQTYDDIQKVPIQNKDRPCTDIICIIIGVGLTVGLIICTIVLFNQPQYQKACFPADTDGKTCGVDYPGYNFLYFAKPTEIGNRVCVASCPSSASSKLQCKKTGSIGCTFGSGLTYYETQKVTNNYGMFCMPKNENDRQALQEQMASTSKDVYYNSVQVVKKAIVAVLALSLLYMLFVQCFPRVMNRIAVVAGIVCLIGLAVCLMIRPTEGSSDLIKYIAFGIAVFILLIVICTFAGNWRSWGLNGVYLDYSTKFLCQRLHTLVYIPIFIVFICAFAILQAFQYRTFWSFGKMTFDPQTSLFHKFQSPIFSYILSALQFIQIIWGLTFIKQAFNYCVSAQSVEWYHHNACRCCNPMYTLFFKHIGSVIACSFMTAFFSPFDFVLDVLAPNSQHRQNQNCCTSCFARFVAYFNLVRSDAMAFVYLSGNAYCNSARYCQYLCDKSTVTTNSQSTSRVYRICAHMFIAGVVAILSLWLNGTQISQIAIIVVILLSLFISYFFIAIHADAAEAIQILFLAQEQFGKRGTSKASQNGKSIGGFYSSKQQQLAKDVTEYMQNKSAQRAQRSNAH